MTVLIPPTLITRAGNGSPLTIPQGDSNLNSIAAYLAALTNVVNSVSTASAVNVTTGLRATCSDGNLCEAFAPSLNGIPVVLNAAFTASLNVSGVGGLDVGSPQTSTWYYLWAIYNGVAVRGLLSLSSTAPLLPTGYTYSSLIGPFYNTSGSGFLASAQVGREVFFAPQTLSNSSISSTSYVQISGPYTTILPPIALKFSGTFGGTSNNATTSYAIAADSNGAGEQLVTCATSTSAEGGGTASFYSSAPFTLPCIAPAIGYVLTPFVYIKATATHNAQVNISSYVF